MHGNTGTLTAETSVNGGTVTFERVVTGTHLYVWVLEDHGDTCIASIKTHGPNRDLDWDVQVCEKTDLDWDIIRPSQ